MTSQTPHSRSSTTLLLERDADDLFQPVANARLLALAPRLQYTLRYLLDTVSDLPREYLSVDFHQAERDAHDLLAKVEGRS